MPPLLHHTQAVKSGIDTYNNGKETIANAQDTVKNFKQAQQDFGAMAKTKEYGDVKSSLGEAGSALKDIFSG